MVTMDAFDNESNFDIFSKIFALVIQIGDIKNKMVSDIGINSNEVNPPAKELRNLLYEAIPDNQDFRQRLLHIVEKREQKNN